MISIMNRLATWMLHPDPFQDEEKAGTASTPTGTSSQPLDPSDPGQSVEIQGLTLKTSRNTHECNCGSFSDAESLGKASNGKTCPHFIECNGEEFEHTRCRLLHDAREPIPDHIEISFLLAQKYIAGAVDPTGWWLSEKLDGVRAYWDGRCFYSRGGHAFHAPDWFTQDLPRHMPLDGELFGGRRKLNTTSSIVMKAEHSEWRLIRYHVFDAPCKDSDPFEKRLGDMKDYFTKVKPSYAALCEQTKCTGQGHIDAELKRVVDLGGEGLMIRQPGSKYERNRSKTLLKIKKFFDAEARVVDHVPSKKLSGLTGALWVEMACGKKFKLGSGLSHEERRHPPKIGSIVTYKFLELSDQGTPRSPSYIGIRIDMDEPNDAESMVLTAKNN